MNKEMKLIVTPFDVLSVGSEEIFNIEDCQVYLKTRKGEVNVSSPDELDRLTLEEANAISDALTRKIRGARM